jgi:ElaB/YqjD/DUF883 family membrane-anchored ribosome-binding protein
MENEPEVIRGQMEATRTGLTEKLEQLEQAVVGTVEQTTGAVTETVKKVQEAVEGTVEAVKETVEETVEEVRETFNLSRHVRRHPWLMVGGAVAVGYVAGRYLGPAAARLTPRFDGRSDGRHEYASAASAPLPGTPLNPAPAPAQEERSVLGKVFEAFAPEVDKLKGLAIAALVGTLGEKLTRELPPEYAPTVKDVIQSITTKLGGTVT